MSCFGRYVRGDVLFVPSAFADYLNSPFRGYLDPVQCEKAPLLRALRAVSRASLRLLKALGYQTCSHVDLMLGLEQEFFLIPEAAYCRRPDLQKAGRTLIGVADDVSSDLWDSDASPASGAVNACMIDIQHEAFKSGMHLEVRHRETAPNQVRIPTLLRDAFPLRRPSRRLVSPVE